MNSNTSENSKSEGSIDSKSCTYPETIKERVYKDSYPGNEYNVVIMFMRIFMRVIMVMMVMCMRGKYFLEEVDSEETSNKHINSMSILFHRFGENMHECY